MRLSNGGACSRRGQRVVLDITARTAGATHAQGTRGKIPVHLRMATGGRRSLTRARAQVGSGSGAVRRAARAIADEFFDALLTAGLRRPGSGSASSGWPRGLSEPRTGPCPGGCRGDARQRQHLPSRSRPLPVGWGRDAARPRRAKRRPGLYPAYVVLGIVTGGTPKHGIGRASRAVDTVRKLQAQLRAAPCNQDRYARGGLSLRCAGTGVSRSAACRYCWSA